MKSTGMTRNVDELGRVVLPIELRRTLGIEPKDALEIFVDGEHVILRKYRSNEDKLEMIKQLEKVKVFTQHSLVADIMDQTIDFIKKA